MLRAVLVGCGLMSRAWLEAVREIDGLSIVGLVDIDVARAEGRAAEFGLSDVVIGSDAAAVIDAVKPDLVFDVVVPDARHGLALTALGRGCHLLTEKPMADSLAHAEDIIAAARKADRLHAVVQNRRSNRGRSATSPASTATSSSPRISVASARRWTTSSSSTWRSIPSTRRGS